MTRTSEQKTADEGRRLSGLSGFAPGTRLAVPDGVRRIETLEPGDPVLTAGGETLAVLWRAATRLRDAPGPARPVQIAAGHLRAEAPLRLAPGTPVVVDRRDPALVALAWLAEAGAPGARAARGQAHPVYHHLMLARPAVVLVQGVQVASFHPGPAALAALSPPLRRSLMLSLPGGDPARALRRYGAPVHPGLSRAELALLLEDDGMLAPVPPQAGAA